MKISLKSLLSANIVLPSSKSISARALIVNALAETQCALEGLSDCDDTKAVLRAFAADASCAADASRVADGEMFAADGQPRTIDIGAAGTAMRFLTAYYSTRVGEAHLITGTERMKHRPIGILVDALRQLGADIAYAGEDGFPPLLIRGRQLRGGHITVKASVSSQYISALLMLGPTLSEGLHLTLEGEIASRPYIEMTLRLMREFGAEAEFSGHDIFVRPGAYGRTDAYSVEPDWSAASYWYELVALCPDAGARVVLPGLRAESLQGDSICARYFEQLGVKTTFDSVGAVLTKSPSSAASVPLTLDFSDCPDLAQTFVVTAAMQNRPFRFTGLRSLKIKETDRVAALIAEAAKLGKTLYESAEGELAYDGLASVEQSSTEIEQGSVVSEPPSIATYEDHRMAMAFAPAAYLHDGLNIEHPEVVSKSYPNFWDDLPSVQ